MPVLVLDDDPQWVERIAALLAALGREAIQTSSWRDALVLLRTGSFSAFILDLHLGVSIEDGLLLLSVIQEEGLAVPTAIVSLSADLPGVTGRCFPYSFVHEVIPKTRFHEFSFPFQRFVRIHAAPEEGHAMADYSHVFVIHGRDTVTRDRIVAILSGLRLIPIVLEREATSGRTIIELVEQFSEVNYAVAIMTADDVGALADATDSLASRARQNVIFEIGYVMARLGRARVMMMREDVEMPSDLSGIRWVDISCSDEEIRTALMRDFQGLGDVTFHA